MSNISGVSIGDPRTVTATHPLIEVAGADPDSGQSDYSAYRRLGATNLDVDPLTHERMQQIALALYRRNPMAYRLVRMVAAFAAGGAIRFEAEHKGVQEALMEHWNHPLNDWERQFPQVTLELGLYGEVFQLANVIESTGSVTWGHIDPLRVPKISPDDKDRSRPAIAHIKTEDNSSNTTPFEIIGYDGTAQSPTKGHRAGQVLYHRTNGVRGTMRGMSDLFPLADYLDGLDQFMFALQQRVQHQNNWIWDVTLEGASESDIRTWLQGQSGRTPRPGAMRVHNERVAWQAVAPEFSSSESTEHARLFRNYMLAGAGLADWVIGDMSSANRAATENSSAVIMKTMEQRQREAKGMIEDVFNFVIDQKIAAGVLPSKRRFNRTFHVTLPKIGIRDFQRVASSLRQGAEGITKLIDAELISLERGQSVADQLLRQLDLEGSDRFASSILEGDEDEALRGD